MKINTAISGNRTIIKIAGTFDANKQEEFLSVYKPLLRQSVLDTLVLDMAGIERFNSSSLGMLVQLLEYAQVFGKVVLLSRPNPCVLKILKQANFHHLFAIEQASAA